MKQGKFSMRLVLKIQEDENNTLSASFSLPDRGARNLPVNAVLYNHPDLLIEFDQFGGVFRGTLDLENETYEGAWHSGNSQGRPMANKMTFKKIEDESDDPIELDFEFVDGDPAIKGYWKGTLQPAPEIALDLILRIGTDADGQLMGLLDVPEQGGKDIPASDLKFESPKVSMNLSGIGLSFEGQVLTDARTIEGKMKSPGPEFEVRFERLDSLDGLGPSKLSYESPSGNKEVIGFWEGTLEVQGTELRLAVAVGLDSDGKYQGTMDSLDQSARGLPMSSLEITDGTFVMKWAALGATYSGDLEGDGDVLNGNFQQGPIDVPFKMERRSAPPAAN